MLILSNGFPTNLPDSEKVSQGGPANFARLFINHLLSSNADHRWVGVMLESTHSGSVRLKEVFSSNYRGYYRLYVPKSYINKVTRAKYDNIDPADVWQKPIGQLTKLIQQEKPDVVFLNGFGILNWMLLKAAKQANIPVVIQHAGIWTKELEIHKDHYSEHGRQLLKEMEKDSTQLSAVEIFLNRWSRDYYHNNVAKGEIRKTEVIPLPFDFASFKQLSAGEGTSIFDFDKQFFHIGIIARWDEIKNHKAVLGLAKCAHDKKLPWQFHAVVDIPNTKKYKKDKLEYERYVDVVAPLDRAGISDFCRSIDLLFLPSLFDVSPTVVLEAVALGTPIAISPNVGYVHDFITCGGSAWVINPTHAERAIESISRIKNKKMPAALKKRLLSIHDHRKVFPAYLEIFAEARIREMPLVEAIRTLWYQNIEHYFSALSQK